MKLFLHGISDPVFRLFPLMKSLCSLGLNLGFNWNLRKGNDAESLSTFDFWTFFLLFTFFPLLLN